MLPDESFLALLARPIAISIAGRNAAHRPSVAHAYGARVVEDGKRIRIIVLRDEAHQVLADIESNGEVATVYSDVRSFRSLQIKGHDAIIDKFDEADAETQSRHYRMTADELVSLGYAASLANGVFSVPRQPDFVTVMFTPTDVFQQTPGPGAGARLDAPKPGGAR